MHYLLKTEPSAYSFADLIKEGQTVWEGVRNPQAVKNLAAMKKGDRLVIYHTGNEKQAVGTAAVIAVDAADPKTPRVTIKVGKPLPQPVTLAQLKTDPLFKTSPLITQGRLSVVPLTVAQYNRMVD